MARIYPHVAVALIALAAAAGPASAQPLSNGFTYQGELQTSGTPVDGPADLRFTLWTAATGGTQIGATVQALAVDVSAGRFTVTLNAGNEFGAGAFNGQRRWLEISVRTPDSGGAYQVLSPRQEITAAPYAAFAADARTVGGQSVADLRNAASLTGTLPEAALPTSVARLSTTNAFSGLSFFSNPGNIFTGAHFGTFSGNGAGLENLQNLNAGAVTTGILADARLSPNVALRNAPNTFSGLAIFNDRVGVGTAPFEYFRMHLNGGSGPWKGGVAAGGTISTVVLGELGGRATIGANDPRFTYWTDLRINPSGGRVIIGGGGQTDSSGTLHVASGAPASLGGGGYIMVGSAGTPNLLIDDDGIIARNNGAASKLYLNRGSGAVTVPMLETDLGIRFSNGTVMTSVLSVQEAGDTSIRTVSAGGWGEWSMRVPGARLGMGVVANPVDSLQGFDVLAFARVNANDSVIIRIQNNGNDATAYVNSRWIFTLLPATNP
ncbi:MAG: hypothetical protein JSR77_14890 [Planctomycetes bacterium]|nr:hypothetical protein [Planctomycetota bacterium]